MRIDAPHGPAGRRRAAVAVAVLLAAGACTGGRTSPLSPEQPEEDHAVVLRVTVPAGTPAAATVYLAGSFNGWDPGAAGWELAARDDGDYAIALPDHVRGPIQFKFTLGSWQRVETNASGGDVPNRQWTVPASGSATYTGVVAGWRDQPPPVSTATASVSILSEAFAMPELDRTRRVWLYLPPDYADSDRSYPVLYMQDGQNVFDAATSYAGEWGVDEALDSLHALGGGGVIVVAVDHAGPRRVEEYSPWGGDGDAYADFLANTLKPYIDAHYRTRPAAEHTGVAGSSMGGLISLYAALKYPGVFGLAGVFSPAFWTNPPIYDWVAGFDAARPRLYFVSGALEGTSLVEGHERMVGILGEAGFDGTELVSHLRADGTHAEWFWRREFPAAFLWLYDPAADAP
jgi:enterochelin esterase-like enzyme